VDELLGSSDGSRYGGDQGPRHLGEIIRSSIPGDVYEHRLDVVLERSAALAVLIARHSGAIATVQ
jgi:hypothetical protein